MWASRRMPTNESHTMIHMVWRWGDEGTTLAKVGTYLGEPGSELLTSHSWHWVSWGTTYYFVLWWWYSEVLRESVTRQRPGVRTLIPPADSQNMNVSAEYQHNTPKSKTGLATHLCKYQYKDQTRPDQSWFRGSKHPSLPAPTTTTTSSCVHLYTPRPHSKEKWESGRKSGWLSNLPERTIIKKNLIQEEKEKKKTWYTIN